MKKIIEKSGNFVRGKGEHPQIFAMLCTHAFKCF